MARCRVYQMADGSVRVTKADYAQKDYVLPGEAEAAFYARLFSTALAKGESPTGVPFVEVDDAAVPWHTKAMGFREAWRMTPAGCEVDIPVCRLLRLAQIRTARDARFARYDAEWMKAMGEGDTGRAAAVDALRRVLRDVPQVATVALVDRATPVAIAAYEPVWPVQP